MWRKFWWKIRIVKVDLCYKLKNIIELKKELEEKIEKIERIKSDPKQIKNNKELNLEGYNRKYFGQYLCCFNEENFLTFLFSFLFCSKEENLGTLIKEAEKIQVEIDTLIENAKQNTLEYFGGAAFITFESIKEQELYLKNIPNDSISYFF